eukprot:588840-Rhodomonas_salina.2
MLSLSQAVSVLASLLSKSSTMKLREGGEPASVWNAMTVHEPPSKKGKNRETERQRDGSPAKASIEMENRDTRWKKILLKRKQ